MESHTFDNGIKVYKNHLLDIQLERYKNINKHEPIEEKIFVNIVHDIAETDLYVGIGAAIGYYPILLRKIRPRIEIHAFEPLDQHLQFFKENIKLNKISTENFTIHPTIVSDKTGTKEFAKGSYWSHVKPGFFSKKRLKYIFDTYLLRRRNPLSFSTCRSTTIDHFIENHNRCVGLIQIDVQGHELNVLKGASKALKDNKIKKLLIGSHGNQIHLDCIKFLSNFNYDIEINDPTPDNQPDGIILAVNRT